ncbi:hypothetical protein B296_00001403 [Ensete ventricosum]|uniref:Uncharacterized protein n=1 Tax=Ensete ventricosum TaxID=4639 RepID=A0A427AMS2_ENSVE|nr:hypothetical protein B296_00001403 [Ensete ventricosum]
MSKELSQTFQFCAVQCWAETSSAPHLDITLVIDEGRPLEYNISLQQSDTSVRLGSLLCSRSHDLYGPSSHRFADSVSKHMSTEQSANLFKPLLVPDLPRRVEVVRAQSLKFFSYPGWEKLHDEAMEAESTLMGW